MSTDSSATPQGNPPPSPPKEGHEPTDVHVGWIFGIVGLLAAAGVAIHFILAGILQGMKQRVPATDQWRPVTQPAGGLVAPGPPFPLLQVSPPTDLQEFRAREDAALNGYGWIDRTAGVVRIPIERAMELVLERGLPVRNETNARPGPSSYELQQQRLDWHRRQQPAPPAREDQQ